MVQKENLGPTHEVTESTSLTARIIMMGDFNSRMESSNNKEFSMMGTYREAYHNIENKFINLCIQNMLNIMNTYSNSFPTQTYIYLREVLS